MNEARIRVLTADDHPLLRDGIATIINNQPDMTLVSQAGTGREAIQMHREFRPDVTLMDLRLPDMSGIEAMIAIRGDAPQARVIILSTYDGDAEIQRALQAGANSYLLKNMSQKQIVDTMRQVHAGRRPIPPELAAQLAEYIGNESLSERESEVLKLVAGGNRNKDIGERLFITEETVKAHLRNIMEKLYAKDRTEAVAIAVRRGIIHL